MKDAEGGPAVAGRWNIRSLVLCIVVLAAGAVGFAVTVNRGHTDSAMLFVGLPTLLALVIVFSPPARSVHGMTFKGLTLGLLLAGVILHEGAICVLFAAPLVYGCGHLVAALVAHSRKSAYAVVPMALLLGLEGLTPGLRLAPDQAVTVTHTVAASPAEVRERIAAGPDVASAPRSWLLANMPLPAHVAGAGLDRGDRWTFHFHGDSHGPGGQLITEVTTAEDGRVTFRRVSDTSIVARWLDWNSADLQWRAVNGATTVSLTMRFTRGLDPSWYFGPVENAMVGASADFLLDALGLPDQA